MERTSGILGWSRWLAGWWSLPVCKGNDPDFAGLAASRSTAGGSAEWQAVRREDHGLRSDSTPIEWIDFGAGEPEEGKVRFMTISELARKAASDARKGKWLMAVAHAASNAGREPIRVLELGTCLGSGADHLVSGAGRGSRYLGLEGSSVLAAVTEKRLARHGAEDKEIKIEVGPFARTLPRVVASAEPFDVLFLDGRHEGDALVDQCRMLQPLMENGAYVIMDDIRWSKDMHRAWLEICSWPGSKSLDLFRMGVWSQQVGVSEVRPTQRPRWWWRA